MGNLSLFASPHNRLVAVMLSAQILAVGGLFYFWSPAWLMLTAVGVFLFVSVGTECYLHRYLSHQSYKVNKLTEVFMHFCGVFALQGSPILWAANHITHHKHADRDGDPHPATMGWKAWFWVGTNTLSTVSVGTVKRLMRDPLCAWTHKHYLKLYISTVLAVALADPRIAVYLFLLPAMWSFHAAGFVTVVLHRSGRRRFETQDNSRNLAMAALFVGSHLHNNHHANPGRYNDAVVRGEVDIHGLLIHHVLRRV